MSKRTVPDEVMDVIKSNLLAEDETIKVIHQYDDDGVPCSLHKSAALAITRKRGGWTWFCHRCQCRGGLKEILRSGDQVKEYLESAKASTTKPLVPDFNINLPTDTRQIVPADLNSTQRNIPWDVVTWLLKSNITREILNSRFIGWSLSERRIIFPVTTSRYTCDGTFKGRELIGWVGRDPVERTKAERQEKGIPKYITRKAGGVPRIIYSACPIGNENLGMYVLTEDIASAEHVSFAAGCNAFALLSTDVPRSLLDRLSQENNKAPIILWLDGDMTGKMISETAKLRTLGYDLRFVRTEKDPKYYSYTGIRLMLKKMGSENSSVVYVSPHLEEERDDPNG
jgi:hypothetical protein